MNTELNKLNTCSAYKLIGRTKNEQLLINFIMHQQTELNKETLTKEQAVKMIDSLVNENNVLRKRIHNLEFKLDTIQNYSKYSKNPSEPLDKEMD